MNPTIVVLAAGMSSRYGRIKQLEPFGPEGETLLDYSVFDALRAGFSRVVLVIRRELEDAFREHVEGRWPRTVEVHYHFQRRDDLPAGAPEGAVPDREKPWGTAHALLTARPFLAHPFVVLNADDFYGSSPFREAISLLRAGLPPGSGAGGRQPDVTTFALMAFTLRDTLSGHGGVNRGLCRVSPDGWLEEVREVFDIVREEGGLRGRTFSGRELALTGEEPTSTNFWVFTPQVFPFLEAGFRRFLDRAVPAGGTSEGEGEPEYLIPTEVNRWLEAGEVRVRVPRAGRSFLGITHPADRDQVVEGLRRLTLEGRYPTPLWGGGG